MTLFIGGVEVVAMAITSVEEIRGDGRIRVMSAEIGKPLVVNRRHVIYRKGNVLFIPRWLDERIFTKYRSEASNDNGSGVLPGAGGGGRGGISGVRGACL